VHGDSVLLRSLISHVKEVPVRDPDEIEQLKLDWGADGTQAEAATLRKIPYAHSPS